jgi:hypothetical protein
MELVVVRMNCIVCYTLDAGLLARSQYPEGAALTSHLGTGFSWFSCV